MSSRNRPKSLPGSQFEIFADWCLTEPKKQEFRESGGTLKKRWYFNSRRLGVLKHYADLFYIPQPKLDPTKPSSFWVKRVPETIGDLLNSTSFAYWFMDDGGQKWSGKSRAVRLSTHGFTAEAFLTSKQF